MAAAVGGVVFATNHGGGASAAPTPTSVLATSTSAPPSTSVPASPGQPLNTGLYSGTIAVDSDPQHHADFIGGMPSDLTVFFTRNTSTPVVTIQIVGNAPFIAVTRSATTMRRAARSARPGPAP
jgi:hypothetical protein